jgi:N-hydroxyarylamine O-acetyltransferase
MTVEQPGTGVLDLPAYLRRIGYAGPLDPTPALFEALHLAHATRIPFENLDILLGRPIRLDLDSLQAKLVLGDRGGYCFEQNTLFAAVLRALGFGVTLLGARVRYGANRVTPRTHMALQVRIDDAQWLADVGFGATGLLLPVRFEHAREVRQFAWTYRLIEDAETWVLQLWRDSAWLDLYAFTLEPQFAVDFEVANHYVSTHPQSRFVQTLTAQRLEPEARHTLVNRELSVDRGTEISRRSVHDDDELLRLLGDTFGLRFPSGTRFRVPTAG